MNKQLIQKVHKKYIDKLKYLNVPHKKLVICFSGFAGSGKTYIAKIIEKEYKAVRIRSDDIRKIVIDMKIKEIDDVTYGYIEWLCKNWKFKNKLIILDMGIDRKYKETFKIFRKKKYKIFIIRLNVSKKTAYERVFERNKGNIKHFNSEINRWICEWKDCGKNINPNIVINTDKELRLDSLFGKLDKFVN